MAVAATTNSIRSPRRRMIIWACFVGSMTAVTGVLLLGDSGAPAEFLAARPTLLASINSHGGVQGSKQATGLSPIAPREAPVVAGQWTGIVVHHSSTPAGDDVTLDRDHIAAGLSGLGYHFVIGNGQGLADGVIHVGYRWNQQLPGAHVASASPAEVRSGISQMSLSAADASLFNRHTIGICLVGNGNRRPFTDRQLRELVALVRELQTQLGIPGSAVYLHSDLSKVESPGKNFPAAEFEAQIRR